MKSTAKLPGLGRTRMPGLPVMASAVAWISLSPLALAAPPEFQKTLSDLRIANMCQQWRAAEMIADFASKKKAFIPAGGLVQRVAKNSFAELHGIVPGSMLVKRGDFEYGASRTAFNPATYEKVNATAGELVWATPDNVLHSAPIKKELIGVLFGDQRNMATWFLVFGQRDPQWDELVVTALLSQGEVPTVSESCWAAAVAKGYRPDRLLHWCGIFLSLARADHAGAEAHATAYGEISAPRLEGDFPLRSTDLSAVALRTGEMKWLVPMVKAFPNDGNGEANARYMGELALKFPRPTDPPSKLAQKMKRRSFLKDGTTEGPEWTNATPDKPEGNKMSGLLKKAADASDGDSPRFAPEVLEAPVNHYRSCWLMPKLPARDLDVELTFQIRAGKLPNDEPAQFHRTFSFGLCDIAEKHPADVTVPCLTAIVDYSTHATDNDPAIDVSPATRPGERNAYQVWNGFSPEQRQLSTLPCPAFKLGKGDHRFRVTRVGNWAEILLDGKRLALAPVPPEIKHPGLFLRIVGCEVTATELRADILE